VNFILQDSRAKLAQVGMITWPKWRLFQLLERLSDLRGNAAAAHLELAQPQRAMAALWVFASTIGELNAIEPFLRQLAARLPHLKLVLITDHSHYRSTYATRYPDAVICVTHGHGSDARMLAQHYPPRLLVVAEIPCLPSDAPCRFSFAFVLEAKRCGAVAAVVNGWLYHYAPACRMDGIERRLFQRAYLRAFDVLCVQTESTRDELILAGAVARDVIVTGNIKFDAMLRSDWHPAQAHSPRILGALIDSARPIIVAGCVTDLAEQANVLDAFSSVRMVHADALLVIAPRHPEVTERMRQLQQMLSQRGFQTGFRSAMPDAPIGHEIDCLVLDTTGDLRDFYAAATAAHVGVDHNVLEPLAFGKPVSVAPGWQSIYPSYPVYKTMIDQQAIFEASDAVGLAQLWTAWIAQAKEGRNHLLLVQQALEFAVGAVDRHFTALAHCLQLISRQGDLQ
jgi:3-deoxy-D-manno-octulosonic-acid transferase